jgi:hypothetical protein
MGKGACADKVAELEGALAEAKLLGGITSICAYCKKIRDDENIWHQLESYMPIYSGARFSHGICPECYEKQMLEITVRAK